MKMSRLYALAVMACISFASAAVAWARPVFEVAVATARAAKNLVLDGFKLAANADAEKTRSVLPFVQAKSFVQRLVKRERPEVTGGWRMCPST